MSDVSVSAAASAAGEFPPGPIATLRLDLDVRLADYSAPGALADAIVAFAEKVRAGEVFAARAEDDDSGRGHPGGWLPGAGDGEWSLTSV